MKKYGTILWVLILVAISAFLFIPATNEIFRSFNGSHPYIMGFVKFAILATMGEILAHRLTAREWQLPKGLFQKAIVWGIIGIVVVFMFKFYPEGVQGMQNKGYLPVAEGYFGTLIFGFFVSFFMNGTFGPVFMALHRISDRYIEERVGGQKPSVGTIVKNIDWHSFLTFTVGKTIPLFWIPAHTMTFLFPVEYRVVIAAYLSICLGIILSLAKRGKDVKTQVA